MRSQNFGSFWKSPERRALEFVPKVVIFWIEGGPRKKLLDSLYDLTIRLMETLEKVWQRLARKCRFIYRIYTQAFTNNKLDWQFNPGRRANKISTIEHFESFSHF